MPPPSTRVAVTVAPATGSFAEFVTMPTIAPADAFTTGAGDSSAWAAGQASPVVRTANRRPFKHVCEFIDLIPLSHLPKPKKQIPKIKKISRRRTAHGARATFGGSSL